MKLRGKTSSILEPILHFADQYFTIMLDFTLGDKSSGCNFELQLYALSEKARFKELTLFYNSFCKNWLRYWSEIFRIVFSMPILLILQNLARLPLLKTKSFLFMTLPFSIYHLTIWLSSNTRYWQISLSSFNQKKAKSTKAEQKCSCLPVSAVSLIIIFHFLLL